MSDWPELSEERDGPTIKALHLYAQIAGKVATAVLPWRNHGWHVTLHVGPRGYRTEPIHAAAGPFELEFDLVDHRFLMSAPDRDRGGFALEPMTVAAFYERVLSLLSEAGHIIPIHTAPNEVDPATPFMADRAARPYDRDSVDRLRRALVSADRVLRLFRSAFLGKVSPVHLFWGSFDLAVTRFSGRRAPLHPGGIPNLPDDVTREAYSHEVSSAGFWPGGAGAAGGPFFYSYAYPAPDGFAEARIRPEAAHYDKALGEFVLPYEAVRTSREPDEVLLAFLESSYAAAANLGAWEREALECEQGRPSIPRVIQPPRNG